MAIVGRLLVHSCPIYVTLTQFVNRVIYCILLRNTYVILLIIVIHMNRTYKFQTINYVVISIWHLHFVKRTNNNLMSIIIIKIIIEIFFLYKLLTFPAKSSTRSQKPEVISYRVDSLTISPCTLQK